MKGIQELTRRAGRFDRFKLRAKRLLTWLSQATYYLPTRTARRMFIQHVAPRLMDERTLSPSLVPKRMRHAPYRALCSPYTYIHQPCYWFGLLFEQDLENYMLRAVQPGDTVMDVGMNVGHVSVLAAGIVGTEGRVISFEPNIALATLIQEHLSRESIQNVTILPYALGAAPGRFPLRLDPYHSGGATLRSGADMSHEVQCDVAIGDEVMASQTTPGKLFLKLDVEGFEVEALLGLRTTLTRVAHAVVEVSPEWLGKDGVEKLFWLMRQAGLFPFVLLESGEPAGPLQARDISTQVNVLFLRPTGG